MPPKPKIEKLFEAMMQFGLRNQMAGFDIVKWNLSRQMLYNDLSALGIADLFDWSGD